MIVLVAMLIAVPLAAGQASADKVFVRADQAAELIGAPNVRIIDCRRDKAEYDKGHVPGAVFLNVFKELRVMGAWDTVGVRRGLEDQEELFGRQLGINNDTMVLLYDSTGWDATRLFWELKYTGHDKVALIYGGWPEWTEQNLPVDDKAVTVEPEIFVSTAQPELLATASYIMKKMGDPNVVLLDARPAGQYKGDAKHGKAAIGGRLPAAVNRLTLANWENDTYLMNPAELEEIYADLGVTPDKEIIAYCNTGYFAANTYFVLKAIGFPNVRVYDYSWVEWSGKGFLPKVEGTAVLSSKNKKPRIRGCGVFCV
jgi:thiosulfate/3-mercaptopyruvate sulfurtransferase